MIVRLTGALTKAVVGKWGCKLQQLSGNFRAIGSERQENRNLHRLGSVDEIIYRG